MYRKGLCDDVCLECMLIELPPVSTTAIRFTAKDREGSKQNHFDVITPKCRPDHNHCVGQIFLLQPNCCQWNAAR